LFELNSCDVMKDFKFKYQTSDEFNDSTLSVKVNIELSVLHMNIRSLNAKCTQLCQLLQLVNIQFDVIILSEVWTTNIDCYSNMLPNYNFYYDLSRVSKVGGVAMFVKNNYEHEELVNMKINSSSLNIENRWIKIKKCGVTYIVGGIYRHPNQNIAEFTSALDTVLSEISSQKIKCIIAGDINIDLTKCTVSSDTNAYVDNLVMNNFVPTILMPTRITSLSTTLIDHIYYYDGYNSSSNICSGNLLCDYISDHLPNYTFILSNREACRQSRPFVHIFSKKNMDLFSRYVSEADWSAVHCTENVNSA